MPTFLRNVPRTSAFAALAFGLGACERGGCVELRGPTPLLERPSPMRGLPREPNRAVAVLPAGRYQYRSTVMGKDYLMYELRSDTLRGFVMFDSDSASACR